MAARELPDEIGLHRTEEDLPPLRLFPDAGNIVQDPADLGGGEVRVQQQARGGLDPFRKSPLLQLLAQLCRAAALPDNGVIHRPAGRFLPEEGGLPLVGNPDAQHLTRLHSAQRVRRRPAL